uniref:WD repeat and SOCS box containing 2 n=1 Tax=Xiphophorus couchianus TaxID=32473 RepID=A0A3B5LS47_9TELE
MATSGRIWAQMRPPSLLDLAGCETWSVDFSPDGDWFAWSMGHGYLCISACLQGSQ